MWWTDYLVVLVQVVKNSTIKVIKMFETLLLEMAPVADQRLKNVQGSRAVVPPKGEL